MRHDPKAVVGDRTATRNLVNKLLAIEVKDFSYFMVISTFKDSTVDLQSIYLLTGN